MNDVLYLMCLCLRVCVSVYTLMEVARMVRMVVKVSRTDHLWTKYHTYLKLEGPNHIQGGELAIKQSCMNNCIGMAMQKVLLYKCYKNKVYNQVFLWLASSSRCISNLKT